MPKLLYPENCPECGHRLSRSRRRGILERVITRFFLLKVLRCHRCQARFYSPPAVMFHAPGSEEPSPDSQPPDLGAQEPEADRQQFDEATVHTE